ncbi:hypothetical protein B0T21DRAFT_412127 [Apiosordaria backusii]|uniref:Uncharacterized protein n=1 Tax=Apiosordaria backusii TaxID=314023 RepID=A0AA40BJU6_9PEZI|nr:hypothetical protein B0T21DRAFT_412127 [Apiosordaria backusii]
MADDNEANFTEAKASPSHNAPPQKKKDILERIAWLPPPVLQEVLVRAVEHHPEIADWINQEYEFRGCGLQDTNLWINESRKITCLISSIARDEHVHEFGFWETAEKIGRLIKSLFDDILRAITDDPSRAAKVDAVEVMVEVLRALVYTGRTQAGLVEEIYQYTDGSGAKLAGVLCRLGPVQLRQFLRENENFMHNRLHLMFIHSRSFTSTQLDDIQCDLHAAYRVVTEYD